MFLDRQTGKQTDRQTDRQIDTQTQKRLGATRKDFIIKTGDSQPQHKHGIHQKHKNAYDCLICINSRIRSYRYDGQTGQDRTWQHWREVGR